MDFTARINEEIFRDEEYDLTTAQSPPTQLFYTQPSFRASADTNNVVLEKDFEEVVIGAVAINEGRGPRNYTRIETSNISVLPPATTEQLNFKPQKVSMKRKNKEISDTSPAVTSSKLPNSVNSTASLAQKANSLMVSPTKLGSSITDLPVILFQAFNGGDIAKVKEIILEHTIKDCGLKTPSLDREIYGQNHLVDFFQAFSDSHPDAVWVAKKCKYQDLAPSLGELNCRIYFAGTRIFQASLMTQFSDVNMNYHHSDYLFKRPNASLLDEMDISNLTQFEIVSMKELESKGKNLSIFGKGSMKLICNEDKKVTHMYLTWVITSFKEAEI